MSFSLDTISGMTVVLSLTELSGCICCVTVSEGSVEGLFSCSLYQDSIHLGMNEGSSWHKPVFSD